MSKQIRISDELYELIKKDAVPLEDTVDSVLMRWANQLGKTEEEGSTKKDEVRQEEGPMKAIDNRLFTGAELNKLWNVGAKHALYHKEGTYYEVLKAFPGALFDASGYVRFDSEAEYRNCRQLRVTKKTNCPSSIASIPSYTIMRRK